MSQILSPGNIQLLLQGAATTLKLTLLAMSIGISLGTLVGLGRISPWRPARTAATVWVEILRGTPLMVQLLLIVYGIPQQFGIQVNEFTAAVLAFGMNSSAYVGEVIRAGIQSLDKGQMEAARSLGMSYAQAMRKVILPQAFTRVIPPLVNESSALLKETSVVAMVALTDLIRSGQLIASRTYRPFPAYLSVAVLYLTMTFTLSRFASRLERRLRVND
ncbi:MAG: amino acid ABC transporter permease [Symbiobacteriia bacterium]